MSREVSAEALLSEIRNSCHWAVVYFSDLSPKPIKAAKLDDLGYMGFALVKDSSDLLMWVRKGEGTYEVARESQLSQEISSSYVSRAISPSDGTKKLHDYLKEVAERNG